MRTPKIFWSVGISTLAMFAVVQPAVGQTEPISGSLSSPAAGEIVVTARRQAENIQKVPQAITALTQASLTQAHIQNAYDLNSAVPGLSVQSGSGNSANAYFSIRGRGFNYGAATGSVETYFADVPLSSPFHEPGLPAQFFDLENLQVLKGPQGTLFGRNTTGGAVLLVPHAPTDRFEGYVRLQGGDFGDFQAEGAINIPIGSSAALRIAGFDWQRKGYMHNTFSGIDPVTGAKDFPFRYQNQDVQQVRATLRVDVTPQLRNTLLATYTRNASLGGVSMGLNLIGIGTPNGKGAFITPGNGSYYQSIEQDYTTRRPTQAAAAIDTATYEVSDSIKLKNIFSFIYAQGDGNSPTTVFGIPGFDILTQPRQPKNRQLTDEFQIQGKSFDNRLTWTLGAMYDRTREPISPGTMTAEEYGFQVGHFFANMQGTNIDSFGLYASGTYAITGQVNVTAGYRHTWDKIHTLGSTQDGVPVPTGSPDPCGPNQVLVSTPTCLVTNPPYDIHQKFQGNAANLTIDYHPANNTMLYAGVRAGYKRGGVNAAAIIASAQQFLPEHITEVTGGIKTQRDIAGMPSRINVEVFYDWYRDLQASYYSIISPVAGVGAITTNVPRSRYYGADVELHVEPARWLTLDVNYTHVNAKNTRWPDPTVVPPATGADLLANPVPFVNKNKVAVSANLHGVVSSAGDEVAFIPRFSYQDRAYTGAEAVFLPAGGFGTNGCAAFGGCYVPSYSLVDLRLEWNHIRGSSFSAAFNVTNLTNKYYYTGESATLPFGFSTNGVAPPRMFNFEVSTKF